MSAASIMAWVAAMETSWSPECTPSSRGFSHSSVLLYAKSSTVGAPNTHGESPAILATASFDCRT